MNKGGLRDREVVELLADEPELLAIADALNAARPRRRRRVARRGLPLAAAVAGVALAAATLLGDERSFTDRALAAVGGGPVLHAVLVDQAPSPEPVIEIASGRRIVPRREVEIWFDEDRGLEHAIRRDGGSTSSDVLYTPAGVFSGGGWVFTCAWIAAHPLEAAKARVSCPANDRPGTRTRSGREPVPEVDPALTGFVNTYADALGAGSARWVGESTYRGRDVRWLELELVHSRAADKAETPFLEQVAVDTETFKPIHVAARLPDGTSRRYDVLQIRTVSRESANFRRPRRVVKPSSGQVVGSEVVELRAAARIFRRRPVWLGPSFERMRLVRVERQQLVSRYDPRAGREPTRFPALTLTYQDDAGRQLRVSQSASCPIAFGWRCDPSDPANGYVRLGHVRTLAHTHGLYVTLRGRLGERALAAAVQALTPMPGAGGR
jgi:hypothetical protein